MKPSGTREYYLHTPYRIVLHEVGCQLSFTEMVSARALFEGAERTKKFYTWIPEKGHSGAQIFGSDPEYLSFAAKEMENTGHHLIDLNAGCPKRKVTRTGAGSAMLKDPDNLLSCAGSILDATKVPVGIKMRMGYRHYEEDVLRSTVKDLEGAGLSWLSMHPRTAFQQYTGTADRDLINRMRGWIDIPLIASGDVRSPVDVTDYLERGATAVMVVPSSRFNLIKTSVTVLSRPGNRTMLPSTPWSPTLTTRRKTCESGSILSLGSTASLQ